MSRGGPRHRTLRAWVLQELSTRILHGDLAPGSRLIETDLAAQLGLSRSPIREALRQLEQEGLVITLPNALSYVAPISLTEFDELYEIRMALEPVVACRAALRLTDERADRLRQVLAQMQQRLDDDRLLELVELDLIFHAQLCACAQLPRYAAVLQSVLRQAGRYMAMATRLHGHPGQADSVAEHGQIVERIVARDPEGAARRMREHLEAGRRRTLAMLERIVPTARPPGADV